ncbi:MAG TPA: PIG-L family deacetylase [Ferruginibacter sp.]|nr:PIG-L family deacetylase [Ferruginibacter sp.]HMP20493.1 PIG-L family deacetylase [Ferruginibacter sp.]
MKHTGLFIFFAVLWLNGHSQSPKTYTSSEILQQLKKLNVLGSVLYVAAHPDDENTRLLAYLANEKLYRTGYLSLTRGDGGQNLIGDEQGIDLGLIRTQELLAARRIDGAEQFFTRAYDFGYCKSADEAIATWGHNKILSDVVWVIRKFRPDVIITRFPGDSRAGHGHHAASAILASEAFDAAADPKKFPEQLQLGVTVWQAKRLLWNTFNFGSGNTQRDDQFKTDVGMYNPLLGKSYGEIAALSRSQHKSQGFGVPAQRGFSLEYFETIKGSKPVNDLMDGVDAGWTREQQPQLTEKITAIINAYNTQQPSASLPALVDLYRTVQQLPNSYWKQQKLPGIQQAIENSSGIFAEAIANSQYAVQGDSLKISFSFNNRMHADVSRVEMQWITYSNNLQEIKPNTNHSVTETFYISPQTALTQPYWLQQPMDKGSFNVARQDWIGMAENEPLSATFKVVIHNTEFSFSKPVRYKFTDPVKGEIYQPVYVVPPVTLEVSPHLAVFKIGNGNHSLTKKYRLFTDGSRLDTTIEDNKPLFHLTRGAKYSGTSAVDISTAGNGLQQELTEISFKDSKGKAYNDITEIDYDHIPSIRYFKPTTQKILLADIKITGKHIGYIAGAGDKVPQALEQIGYKVTLLKEADITVENLKQFDAVVTGVRAYNTNDWMNNVYAALMHYVREGGVLVTQYNTSNFISNIKSKIGPYDFAISRNRVTDENAPVKFLIPNHPVLHYPNTITAKDFEGWVQERSIYHADKIDSSYRRVLSMKDVGETIEQDGSLITADYGRGRFVYTGLVFFRQLPAGVPGAYRLFANLVAKYPDPKAKLEELRRPVFKSKAKKD